MAARRTLALLVLIATTGSLLVAQARHPVSGRIIAPVMGYQGASWLDRPEREAEEHPTEAVRALGLTRGQIVADVGAGSGYYTALLSHAVGPTGRVYAADLQPEMLTLLGRRLEREHLGNVVPVLATETDPRLPRGELDLVLMVDVYHELSRPQEVLQNLKAALKPDGRLVLIEYRKESAWVPIKEEHKMSVAEARLEVEAEGFRFDRVIDVLPWQHILIFRRA